MKSVFKICLLVCIPFFYWACSGTEKLQENEFLIEGEISDVEDGVVIELYRWDGDTGTPISSDTVRNGRFIFREKTESDIERLTIDSSEEGFPSMSLGVWVSSGAKIKINGKGKLHPTWEVKSSIPYQKEENRYTNKSRDIIVKSIRLSVESDDLRSKARAAASSEDALAYRKAADSLEVIRKMLRLKELYSDMDIMENTNISPIWLNKMRGITQMLKYGNLDTEYDTELRKKTETLYGRMSEEDKNTPIGHIITSNLFPPRVTEVGDDITDSDFFDVNGNMKHLSDYLGKYLLLDLWSSGCGPCLMAFPEMKEVYESYSENLTIISVSLDTDARWKESMAKHDMPWVNIRDPKGMGGIPANYGARGIPFYIIVSPEGKVADKWSGFYNGFIKRKVSENVK